ncbi:MAG: hypothetical protein PHF25_05695 [Candidatus Margulisbacteria bacterium]|nr:hypothetical protein [Candidatus Margulisiibacteriota bacterium]
MRSVSKNLIFIFLFPLLLSANTTSFFSLIDIYYEKAQEAISQNNNTRAESAIVRIEKYFQKIKELPTLSEDDQARLKLNIALVDTLKKSIKKTQEPIKQEDSFVLKNSSLAINPNALNILNTNFDYAYNGMAGKGGFQFLAGSSKSLLYNIDNNLFINGSPWNLRLSGYNDLQNQTNDSYRINANINKLIGGIQSYTNIELATGGKSSKQHFLASIAGNKEAGGILYSGSYKLKAAADNSSYQHLDFAGNKKNAGKLFDKDLSLKAGLDTDLYTSSTSQTNYTLRYEQKMDDNKEDIRNKLYYSLNPDNNSADYLGFFNSYRIKLGRGFEDLNINFDIKSYPNSNSDYVRIGGDKNFLLNINKTQNKSYKWKADTYMYQNTAASYLKVGYAINEKNYEDTSLFSVFSPEISRVQYFNANTSYSSIKLYENGSISFNETKLEQASHIELILYDNIGAVASNLNINSDWTLKELLGIPEWDFVANFNWLAASSSSFNFMFTFMWTPGGTK